MPNRITGNRPRTFAPEQGSRAGEAQGGHQGRPQSLPAGPADLHSRSAGVSSRGSTSQASHAPRVSFPLASAGTSASSEQRPPRNDKEREAKIDQLASRLEFTASLAARSGPTKNLSAQAFNDAREALLLHSRMSPGYNKDPAGAAKQRGDLLEAALSHASNAILLTFAESREATRSTPPKSKPGDLDPYIAFALQLHEESGRYGSVPRELLPALRESIADTLVQALKVKINLAMADARGQVLGVASLASPLEGVLLHCTEAYVSCQRLIEGEGLDQPQKSQLDACKQVWDGLAKLGAAIDDFSLHAARQSQPAGADASAWDRALDFVQSVSVLASALSEAMNSLYKAESETLRKATHGVQQPHGQEDEWAVVPSRPAQPPQAEAPRSGRRRSRPNRAARTEAPSTAPERGTTDEVQRQLLLRIDDVLDSSPLTLEMARSSPDVLAIARLLPRADPKRIEDMKPKLHDPLDIAGALRTSALGWFGNIAVVRRARSALDSLVRNNPTDEGLVQRASRLDDRIAALEVIDKRLEAREGDTLKQHQFPKASHLKRLLQLDQIAGVSSPVQLRSAGDQGARGTLFELKITPRPLSDGREAPSVYLHLHTANPVTAAECLALKHSDLTAAHVKNEEQKGLGARWEELQRRYGNEDATVYREKVGKELLGTLQQLSKTSLAASAPGTGSKAARK